MKWKDKRSKPKSGRYIVDSGEWSGICEAWYYYGKWYDKNMRNIDKVDITNFVTKFIPFPD